MTEHSNELRAFIEHQHKRARRMIFVGYLTQAAATVTGALMLWLAIDSFLTGAFLWSAVQTAIAYWNAETFINNAHIRKELRASDAALRKIESHLP